MRILRSKSFNHLSKKEIKFKFLQVVIIHNSLCSSFEDQIKSLRTTWLLVKNTISELMQKLSVYSDFFNTTTTTIN